MASKFMRRKTWWIKFQHPATGEILRESLATHDPARAELLRERLDLEIAILDPRFQAVEVPEGVRRLIPVQASVASAVQPIIQPTIVPAQQVFPTMPPAARVPFDERTVTILPPLRRILEKYLPTLRTRWLVPLPKGGRWNTSSNPSHQSPVVRKRAAGDFSCPKGRG